MFASRVAKTQIYFWCWWYFIDISIYDDDADHISIADDDLFFDADVIDVFVDVINIVIVGDINVIMIYLFTYTDAFADDFVAADYDFMFQWWWTESPY